jgi:O-antigen/teichoic acid export membrane protein
MLNLLILLLSSRELGSGIVGQVRLLILNIAVVQIINEIYTGYALVHFIPKFSLRRVYRSGLLWAVMSTLLLNLGILLFSDKPELRGLWIHGLILSFAITLHSFHCVILLAREKIGTYNLLMLFQPLVTVLALAVNIFIFQDRSAGGYITALYISFISSFLLSLFCVLRLLKDERGSGLPFSFKAIIRNGSVNQLGNLAHTLSNRYNYYIIEAYTLVGVYSSATSLIESVWVIGASIAAIILTRMANTSHSGHNSRVTFLMSKLSFLLSLFCVLIILLLPASFFPFLLGEDFADTKRIMLYLSPGVLCISFSTVISHFFSGLGQQKVQLAANGTGLLVTVCTSYFFISRYQLIGACYAASLSYFVSSLILVTVFMRQNQFGLRDLFRLRGDLRLLKKGD